VGPRNWEGLRRDGQNIQVGTVTETTDRNECHVVYGDDDESRKSGDVT